MLQSQPGLDDPTCARLATDMARAGSIPIKRLLDFIQLVGASEVGRGFFGWRVGGGGEQLVAAVRSCYAFYWACALHLALSLLSASSQLVGTCWLLCFTMPSVARAVVVHRSHRTSAV